MKLLLSSEASQEVAMEMGPQAEHDNDLGQGGAAVGARAPLDTRLAHVLSPRKNVKAQLRRTEGPEQGQGFLPTCLAGSLPLSRTYRALKIQCLFGSNCRMLPKWVQPWGRGEKMTNRQCVFEVIFLHTEVGSERFPITQTGDRAARADIFQQVSPQPTWNPPSPLPPT